MKIGLNTMKNTNNDTIKLADIRIVRCEKAHPDKLFYKTSYAQADFNIIDVKQPRKTRGQNIELKKLYASKPGLDEKKKKSIMTLFNKTAIPKYYFNYYNSL